MTLQLSEISIENHRRFVTRVAESGVVWGLKSGAGGWAVCDANADDARGVMPFWSARAYAARAAKEEWSEYAPTSIPLDVFLERWVPGMQRDKLLVGTNWDASNCGLEIEPAALASELTAAR